MHQTLVEAKEVGLENWRREGGVPFHCPLFPQLKRCYIQTIPGSASGERAEE